MHAKAMRVVERVGVAIEVVGNLLRGI